MWWFRKEEPKDIWDEEIKWQIGDIEATDRIRNICRTAADSAEIVGGRAVHADRRGRKSDKNSAKRSGQDAGRYERAARCAMEIALKVSDDLMRDAAVGEIVDLCLKANDLKTARVLFRAIQTDSIREDVLRRHPALQQ